MYSVDSQDSLSYLDQLRGKILRTKGKEQLPFVIAGNKVDLPDRQVTKEQGEAKAAEFGCEHVECSAKENVGIQEIFTSIVRKVRQLSPAKAQGGKKKCGSA